MSPDTREWTEMGRKGQEYSRRFARKASITSRRFRDSPFGEPGTVTYSWVKIVRLPPFLKGREAFGLRGAGLNTRDYPQFSLGDEKGDRDRVGERVTAVLSYRRGRGNGSGRED